MRYLRRLLCMRRLLYICDYSLCICCVCQSGVWAGVCCECEGERECECVCVCERVFVSVIASLSVRVNVRVNVCVCVCVCCVCVCVCYLHNWCERESVAHVGLDDSAMSQIPLRKHPHQPTPTKTHTHTHSLTHYRVVTSDAACRVVASDAE